MALARLASSRTLAQAPRALAASARFQSTTAVDPKTKANSLIESLPGNSVISKTGIVVLGTAVSGWAISSELYVVNEESLVLGSFALLAAYIASAVRGPYREWADGQIDKIKTILNASRTEHTSAVKERIASVQELKDSVSVTQGLFEISKDTAAKEHEAFVLQQRVAIASEIKAALDSWVRFEAQARDAEQKELVKTVIEKVLSGLEDPKTQKDVLASAVSDIEALVKAKKI